MTIAYKKVRLRRVIYTDKAAAATATVEDFPLALPALPLSAAGPLPP